MKTALIKLTERQRIDYGDISELAESIRKYGLLQPIVIDNEDRLIAGGRRLMAVKSLGWEDVPVQRISTLSESQRAEMELEENIRRKDIDWKEYVKAVDQIHNLKFKENEGQWSKQQTAELLGINVAYIYHCLALAKDLDNPIYKECQSLTDAIRVKLQEAEDAARAELVKRCTNIQAVTPDSTPADPTNPQPPPVNLDVIQIKLSDYIVQADCRDYLMDVPDSTFDHIITDPPYAIDVTNISSHGGVSKVANNLDTHDVQYNFKLLAECLPTFYRVLKPTGYLVMWCDPQRFEWLHDKGIEAGFSVQRWPLVWCKSTPAQNMAAWFNTTKNIEFAIFMRRKDARLAQVTNTSWIVAGKDEFTTNYFAKPFDVWKFIIEAVSTKGQYILDPFAGEGSSIRSMMNLLRRPFAIEINPTHFNTLVLSVKEELEKNLKTKVEFV